MSEYFRISIADRNIEIECHNRTVFKCCRNYLVDFAIPDIEIKVTMKELELEASKLPPIEEWYEGVATTRFYGDIENEIIQKKIADVMPSFNTFLMHGSVVSLNNQAYMFTAPSGTGKTTRTRLWVDEYPSSIVINGDKPLIKVTEEDIFACGTPWCGKEGWNTNIMVPLRAIFLLERNDEDNIEEISLGKAFPMLLQHTHHPADADTMRKTIELLKALEGKVKIYRFGSTPTIKSIHLAYETARPR